ncbi:MAG: PfkB family carbohydrate kinase [Oscillospiraceae bacterium]|nr:PfkB family carbohydrate kinase [Oscillospiraceae bacterium]
MKDGKLPRAAVVEDFSCFGKCSLAIALPVISAAGVEACALPSELLSAHTGYAAPARFDLSSAMRPIYEHWSSIGAGFDIIYIGYLAGKRQIEEACGFIRAFKKPGVRVLLDPAMAEGGRLYGGLEAGHEKEMLKLCALSDIVLPNLSEAALLTGLEYSESPGEGQLRALLEGLLKTGPKAALITGVSGGGGKLGAALLEGRGAAPRFIGEQALEGAVHGSGDLFASVCAAALALGLSLEGSARAAARFTALCIAATLKTGRDEREGLRFEPLLRDLRELIDQNR